MLQAEKSAIVIMSIRQSQQGKKSKGQKGIGGKKPCGVGEPFNVSIGCHMNVGIFDFAYKYLLQGDVYIAEQAADKIIYGFGIPVYILLVIFWVPMIVIQFLAFAKGLTPYPKGAKWVNLIVGMIPAFVLSGIVGFHTALGAGIGTMFLSFGNALTFGGLLATLPDQKKFDQFESKLTKRQNAEG